jgi:hypothetical protein
MGNIHHCLKNLSYAYHRQRKSSSLHQSIAAYLRKNDQIHSTESNSTLDRVDIHAEVKILKGCLQSMVCSDWHDFTEKQVGLGVYAAGHWIDYVEHSIGAALGEIYGQEDSQELSELLYQFLNDD